MLRRWVLLAMAVCALVGASRTSAITVGQFNDFQDGQTAGWGQGFASPFPPFVMTDGGPAGDGDAYLAVFSSAEPDAGSKMVVLNTTPQWTGNYIAAGVNRISFDVINTTLTDLAIRVAFRGGATNTRYCTLASFPLPADEAGNWHSVSFDISPAAVVNVGAGSASAATVLSQLSEIRILSAVNGPSFTGDLIAASIGVDNIRAEQVPEPGPIAAAGFAVVVSLATRRRSSRTAGLCIKSRHGRLK
jgi:hypothetical protein